ncbi:ABC transporter permease [Secundilactobacillus malefermentans]|uniref:ABC transporter permease n=1 Tax=Secundilactobacillus malefermentans TaxID=176292 RepID=UPI0011CAD640|nr:ABC transporter permease [Secundilactobacillus malefermentans]QEA31052.1 ABC transporter permease [Secundilactobacillus malefermentans]
MYLAWKEMRYAKLRYALIIGVMVLVAYVVFMLTGLADGLADGNKQAVVDWKASSVILSNDSNKIASASSMKQSDLKWVSVSDKNKAGVGYFPTAVQHQKKSEKQNVSVLGAKKSSFVVPNVTKGRLYQNKHEIIISQNLANLGYHLNQKVKLGSDSKLYKIVGFSKATKFSEVPVIYLNLNAFATLKYGDQVFKNNGEKPLSLIAIKKQSANKLTVSQSSDDTKLDKLSVNTFIQNIPGYSAQNVTLGAMIGFLFVVVAAIIGIFMYVMTLQKTSLFGVMKAQGIKTSYLAKSIVGQALIVGVVGVAIAFVLGYLTGFGLPETMPYSTDLGQWLLDGIVLILVAIIGGLFSIRTVTKVDPINAIGGE